MAVVVLVLSRFYGGESNILIVCYTCTCISVYSWGRETTLTTRKSLTLSRLKYTPLLNIHFTCIRVLYYVLTS